MSELCDTCGTEVPWDRYRCDKCLYEGVKRRSTYNPQTHRLIPNDGSVVVLEREDVERAFRVAGLLKAHADHQADKSESFPKTQDALRELAQDCDDLQSRLRSALDAGREQASDTDDA